jgi:hypothetical protein
MIRWEAQPLFGIRSLDPSQRGTRFRLFPQPPFGSPIAAETIWVSSPVGSVGPGPGDARMYAIDPLGEKTPYGMIRSAYGTPFAYFPPWRGPIAPPVLPDRDGHFDYLEPGMPGFEIAHLFGCVRFTLDVWEGYFGRPVPWHFRAEYDRLELTSLPGFTNAQAGYGFLEVGRYVTESGAAAPFSLNFDIIAHEVGHLIIYSELGEPTAATAIGEYYGFHESAADLVALIAAAHFDSVIDSLLERTRGNLYVVNLLNRMGEISDNEQIRMVSNSVRLAVFANGWRGEHDLSLPLTGAVFDIWVDIFHESLLERSLISPEVEDLADRVERLPEYEGLIQSLFDQAYGQDPAAFKQALLEARDYLGRALAHAWGRLSPDYLNYSDVAGALLEADRLLSGGRYQRLIARNFALRDIGRIAVGPRLTPPSSESHAFSARTLTPGATPRLPRMSYRERWLAARRWHIVPP